MFARVGAITRTVGGLVARKASGVEHGGRAGSGCKYAVTVVLRGFALGVSLSRAPECATWAWCGLQVLAGLDQSAWQVVRVQQSRIRPQPGRMMRTFAPGRDAALLFGHLGRGRDGSRVCMSGVGTRDL
jgi:hypothetical protein